ncbi:MAG: GNAT family N-acetyltransferase [Clostridia bacterium]|nr:GNAT family N-acetyltransferase [Clostridia bacterium]
MINTERLRLMPLTAEELALWSSDCGKFEMALHIKYCGEPVAGDFISFVKTAMENIRKDSQSSLFNTIWLIVRKRDNVAMGELAFYGPPNQQGEVEIGYGLNESFWGNGYMAEAVHAVAKWGLTNSAVHSVIAITDNNPKSEKTLERAGFRASSFNGTSKRWVFTEDND